MTPIQQALALLDAGATRQAAADAAGISPSTLDRARAARGDSPRPRGKPALDPAEPTAVVSIRVPQSLAQTLRQRQRDRSLLRWLRGPG